tara:strand:- start:133 stop:576 length:444 start_codon:yes stop_codon:yes gene_type:complete
MKKSLFLLGIVTLILINISCSPISRHQRLVKKYPFVHTQDTVILIDTITVLIPKIKHDTIFNLNELHDTVYIEKDRLKIKMYRVLDSIYVQGECDSIYIEKIIERKVPIRYYENKDTNWWKWILIIAGSLLFLVLIYTALASKKNQI